MRILLLILKIVDNLESEVEFALDLIEKTKEFELATVPGEINREGFNKLIAYNRYKNKGDSY
jgi:hypothetical protein